MKEKGLEIKKEKNNYRINCYYIMGRKKRIYYWNIIDRDPKKLAQIFLDLSFEGYPIEKAFKIMQERTNKKDWLGF